MSNLNQLEREWRRYKRKERRPLMIAILALTALISSTVFLTFKSENEKKHSQDKPLIIAIKPQLKEKNSTAISEKELNSTIKVSKTEKLPLKAQELRPSFAFMKQIKEERETKKQNRPKKASAKRQTKKNVSVTKKEKKKSYQASKNRIDVSSTSTKDKIDALAKRFNSNRNPLLGIAVAKRYLQSKKYKQAYFYALEVNNIDPNNEDSWLVSAHALYFIKSKNAAMRLLQGYMKKHNSAKALRLYRAMQQGRLK